MSLIRRVQGRRNHEEEEFFVGGVRRHGRRATSEFIDGGWTVQPVPDPETGEQDWYQADNWEAVTKPVTPWRIRIEPPPQGAVRVTPRIAMWFNRVGYYHFTFPAEEGAPQWGDYTKSHGGLYVAAGRQAACLTGQDQAYEKAGNSKESQDWGCWRIRVQPGDYLAVDEDEWNYIQEPYRTEKNRRLLHFWGAGESLREYAAKTDADSMWRAPRAWGEAFVLRWSKPIIDTCVRKGLMRVDDVPNLRVWSKR